VVIGLIGAVLVALAVQRILELRLARRNEAWARAQGAHELGARHYPAFFVLHVGWLVAWPLEVWIRGPALAPGWWAWIGAFVAAQGLRYWAIATLGRRWNTRILVLPGTSPIARGPYRVLAHPNYVAVCIELAAVPLVFGAWWTAAITAIVNAVLLLGIRIPAEVAALAWARDAEPPTRGPAAARDPR
jgi:methyltransferase